MGWSRLDNGVRVVTEHIRGVRSAAVGAWIAHGSAHEAPERMGASHLLEHMVFKGTAKRSAKELALSIESLGGSLDAYTSREHTSYQSRVLDEHVPVALDVIADLVTSPRLSESDLELEREVVLEEISQVEDTPDDLVFELHGERFWEGHPYGHRILGTRETVAGLSVSDLAALHRKRYVGSSLVIAAAGNVEHDHVVELANGLFGSLPEGPETNAVPVVESRAFGSDRVSRETAQTHLVFAAETIPHSDPRRFALSLSSSAFGGGMSSRLFQRVREELGLAYTVFSYQSFYGASGVGGVYVGTRPEWADKADQVVREEYARIHENGIGAAELEGIKNQSKGQVMLSLESTGARLYRLAGFLLHGEPFRTLDTTLQLIDAVTPDHVREVAEEFFDPDRLFSLRLGP